jgi:hypothetical protein
MLNVFKRSPLNTPTESEREAKDHALVLPPLIGKEQQRARLRSESAILDAFQLEGDRYTKKIEIEKKRLEEIERGIKASQGS